jgi:hypothetical protein
MREPLDPISDDQAKILSLYSTLGMVTFLLQMISERRGHNPARMANEALKLIHQHHPELADMIPVPEVRQ